MKIISRKDWRARLPKRTPTKIAVPTSKLFLHHTAGARDAGGNGVWWDDVQGIQQFHQDSRGWNDIAYSYLIGGGQAFEGRGAGIAGSHTSGHNTTSHAICLIGDYSWMDPTDADLEAIAQLVAHGHIAGWWPDRFTGGHRDASGASTACPGDRLQRQLPAINRRITELLAPPSQPEGDDLMARTCIPATAKRATNGRFPFYRLSADSRHVLAYNGARLRKVDGNAYGVPFMTLPPLAAKPVGICEASDGSVVVVAEDGGTIDVAA